MSPDQDPCPECNGRGFRVEHHGGLSGEFDCLLCDGSGTASALSGRKCPVIGQTLEGHHHGCDLGPRHEGFHVCFKCRAAFDSEDCYSAPLAALRHQDQESTP